MEKIAILTDTGSDISKSLAEKFGIYLMSFYLNSNGNYRKEVDINHEEFYKELGEMESFPKTSIPSPRELIEKFNQIKKDGYNKLLVITISDKLSSFNNLCNSLSYVPGLDIKVINSKNVALGSGMLALYASELLKENIEFDELVEKIEGLIHKSKVFFSVNTLKYLKAGGRIGRISASLGEALSIKPIITCDTEDGQYVVLKKIRGKKKQLSHLISMIKDILKDKKKYYIVVSRGENVSGFDRLKEELSEEIENAEKFITTTLTPTLAANTGPGLIGVGFLDLD